MDNYISERTTLLCFEEIYNLSIRPKLEAIDLFLKENTAPFHVYDVANILEIEPNELLSLMQTLQLSELDSINFFTIVLSASSEICNLLSRQWRYARESTYTPEMISEIYKLNIHKVKNAFDDLGKSRVTDTELTEVFKRIHLAVF